MLMYVECRAIRKVPNASVIHLTTSRGSRIVAAWLPYNDRCRATMLFSHGNAVDLGLMLPFYRHAPATPNMHFPGHLSSMPAALSAPRAPAQAFLHVGKCLTPNICFPMCISTPFKRQGRPLFHAHADVQHMMA